MASSSSSGIGFFWIANNSSYSFKIIGRDNITLDMGNFPIICTAWNFLACLYYWLNRGYNKGF